MSFTFDETDQYAREIIEDARLNPSLGVGQPVDVYDNEALYEWIGEGTIVHMVWSEYYCQYVCDVVDKCNGWVWPCVMAGRLEPIRRLHGSWVAKIV